MTRSFEVLPGEVPAWDGMTPAAGVVAAFLARVRVTGDDDSARDLMAPVVRCHQLVADEPETLERTPAEYAAHVRDMLRAYGRFRYTVTDLLAEQDRVYVRWLQEGHLVVGRDGGPGSGAPVTELGSAVYRVRHERIVEYWIQLDRLGILRQVDPDGARP